MQVVEDNLLELLVNLLLLAQDDTALALDGTGLKLGVLEDIGKDVDGLGDIGVEGLGVVNGVLALLTWLAMIRWVHAMIFPVVPRCRR